jgi:hypothetical protein
MHIAACFTRLALPFGLAVALFGTTLIGNAAAQQPVPPPKFTDFPVRTIYKRPVAKPVLKSEYFRDRKELFPSRDGKVDFAGQYIVVKITCGSSCVTGAIMNARTGQVFSLPFTICCWNEVRDDFESIEYRPNSRLVMFSGRRNEKGVVGYHFYVLHRDRLRFLRTIEQADADFSKKLKLD